MKKFAASFYALRQISGTPPVISFEAVHSVAIINASSYEEALGKGHMEVDRLFPQKEGYSRHDVKLMEISD